MSADLPSWLSRFVRDEARPLLLQHRQAALDALARWRACQDDRRKEQVAWDAKRLKFLRELATLPEDQRNSPDPPGEGYAWAEPVVQLDDGRLVRARGWLPLDLRTDNRPATEYPLPPPSDRDVSLDECWAALAAAHDVCRVRREQIGPADDTPVLELRSRALALTEAQLPDLQAMLARVRASLPAETAAEGTPDPRTTKRPKRSTERGGAPTLIVAALTAHHEYDNGSCTNMAPIGVRELKQKYGVGRDAASRFFKHHFRGHAVYTAICRRDPARIGAWLKMLNDGYSPHPLFGSAPPGEGGDSDD